MSERIYSFPPVIDDRARVLIAGTAPSVKSLEHGQFYGHPQNYFWRVVYALFGEPAPPSAGAGYAGSQPEEDAEAASSAKPSASSVRPRSASLNQSAGPLAVPQTGAPMEQTRFAPSLPRYAAPDADYTKRLDFLQAHRLALWDVIYSCEREGSLDVNIKEELPNDFPGLLERYPGITCIAFNGSKAYDTFRKHFGKNGNALPRAVALLKLPSTSPIPTKHMRNLDDRVGAWQAILPYAKDDFRAGER